MLPPNTDPWADVEWFASSATVCSIQPNPALGGTIIGAHNIKHQGIVVEHKLPELPCERNSLAPRLSTETLEYHSGKHHAAHVANLNRFIAVLEPCVSRWKTLLLGSAMLCLLEACAGSEVSIPGSSSADAGGDSASGPVDAAEASEAAHEGTNLELRIMDDADDGLWINGTTELLHHRPDLFVLEVGDDAEAARTGFIFRPAIPPGSQILSARITLSRLSGDAQATDTIGVQVFDSAHMEPFNATHVHPPAQHVPEGIWSTVVPGFALGTAGSDITSPDLAALVQHIVDKADWTSAGTVGFFLAPDQENGHWAYFADSSDVTLGGAKLELWYR